MNIVADSFTGLHDSHAFHAEELVCLPGAAMALSGLASVWI